MAILPIRIYGDPVLRKKSEPITEITPELRQLAQDMLETMYDAPGCGLAAPQIGRNIRLVVIDTAIPNGNRKKTRSPPATRKAASRCRTFSAT